MTTLSNRRTIVAHGRLAMRELRLDAARQRTATAAAAPKPNLARRRSNGGGDVPPPAAAENLAHLSNAEYFDILDLCGY